MKNTNVALGIIFSLAFATNAWAELSIDVTDPQQLNDMAKQLQSFQQSLTQSAQESVMLGTEQYDVEYLNSRLVYLTSTLSNIQKFNQIKNQTNFNLTWKEVSKDNYFNAGNAKEPVYICRAPFLGASIPSKGTYPGQLTDKGCLISFAGYAFFVSHYQVLSYKDSSKDDSKITWVPIEKFKIDYQMIGTKSNTNTHPNKIRFRYPDSIGMYSPVYHSETFSLNQSQPLPIAGGFEGFRPVYICKTEYQHQTKIGKWVNFVGQNGEAESACDIGFDDKEIVVTSQYSLLALNRK